MTLERFNLVKIRNKIKTVLRSDKMNHIIELFECFNTNRQMCDVVLL